MVEELSDEINDLTLMKTSQINRKHKHKKRWLNNLGRAETVYSEGDQITEIESDNPIIVLVSSRNDFEHQQFKTPSG